MFPNEQMVGMAIPLSPPPTSEFRTKKKNEIQSQLMLATDWISGDDPTGW